MEQAQADIGIEPSFGVIDRQSVRKFVSEYTAKLEIAPYCGDNVHQIALDQQDKVDQITANWDEANKLLFSKLYAEELTAYSKEQSDKINLLNAQATQQHLRNAQSASNVAIWISLIVFFTVLISFIKMIK